MDLLRLVTVGSVDDGKSTLIGRLLFDTKKVFTDQLANIEKISMLRGDEYTNLALLTDGLRSEREQGITIDVAYRYFATKKRKFILADCPGHVQYTRNMVTGASTANLAVVLIDARKGLLEQTKRHSFIASLLGIPHLVVCINKMDLVDYDEEVFERIKSDFEDFSARLRIHDVRFIPISALKGDNVVDRSKATPWYTGDPFLNHLEDVHIVSDRNFVDFRFPVQYVVRPQSEKFIDYRAYAGQVASGVVRKGDEITALPSGFKSKVKSIEVEGKELDEAFAPMSVCIRLEDEIDISRGNMLVRTNNQPQVNQDVDAILCWLNESPMKEGVTYSLRQTSTLARCKIRDVQYKIDVNTLRRNTDDKSLGLNEIARVSLRTNQPLLYDAYEKNRATGSLVIVDEATNNTVGAAMII